MLRMPRFEVAEPESVGEALALLARHGDAARPMAGGTDLLPNLKHEVVTPSVVVGLWRIGALRGVRREGDTLVLGATTPLADVAAHPEVQARLPSLAEAIAAIAGPQHRRMGTIGGNVCLDTRCVYVNQTHFWRQALGFCLKKDGTACHVVKGGRRCVAAASNDTAPPLITLGASLRLASPAGVREVAVADYYLTDGRWNQDRRPDELLTEVRVPLPPPGTGAAYAKLRTRAAIDFPELGVAALLGLDGGGAVAALEVVVTALAARPLRLPAPPGAWRGRAPDAALFEAVALEAHRRAKPLPNLASEPAYRREMVPVFVRRALRQALLRARGGAA